MMLVIDKSGSMGGEKIEMAKEAARAAVELLGPSDKVGVLAFEGENFWVSEMHPCTDKGFVLDRIAGLEAGGGTVMAPAMEEAYETLQTAVAKLKHVIILTDGISAPGDFEGIAQAMTADRITVSTVAMGGDADQNLLEEIARIGNGRFYVADDPAQVPADLRQGDGHGQQVGDQRAAVLADGGPPDPGPLRDPARRGPVPAGLRRHPAQADRRGDPGHRVGRPAPGLVALRPGHERGVHLRRQGPMGGRVAHLAAVRPVLGPGRPPRAAQGRGQGHVRAGRAQGPEGRRLARRHRARRAGSSIGRRPS